MRRKERVSSGEQRKEKKIRKAEKEGELRTEGWKGKQSKGKRRGRKSKNKKGEASARGRKTGARKQKIGEFSDESNEREGVRK